MSLQAQKHIIYQCDNPECGAVYDLNSQIDAWFHGKPRIRKGDKCLMHGCLGHIQEEHQ